MIEDMLPHSDPSQYGNRKGISTQHYLINLINRILTSGDKNNNKQNTPTGASTNPKNFDLNKNLNLNLIQFET